MQTTTKTLGEICDEVGGTIRTGPFGSQLHESDYSETGTPVVMPKDILDGYVSEAIRAVINNCECTKTVLSYGYESTDDF